MKQVHCSCHRTAHSSLRKFSNEHGNYDGVDLPFCYSFYSPSSPERELKDSHANCCQQTGEACAEKREKKQHPVDLAASSPGWRRVDLSEMDSGPRASLNIGLRHFTTDKVHGFPTRTVSRNDDVRMDLCDVLDRL